MVGLLALVSAVAMGGVPGCGGEASDPATQIVDAGDTGATDARSADRGGIRGKIIDEYGLPVDSAKVIVAGESTVTKYDGTFVLHIEPERYDLLVASWDGKTVVDVIGLTRRDPVVQMPAFQYDSFLVSVSGRMPPLAAGRWAGVAFSTPGFPTVNTMKLAADGPATSYGVHLTRWIVDEAPATFWLFELSGDPAQFLGYASRTVTFGRAALAAEVDFGPITRVPNGMIHGSLVVPDDFIDGDVFSLTAFVRPPESQEWLEVSSKQLSKANPTGSCSVPVIDGASYAAAFTTIDYAETGTEIFRTWKMLPLGGTLAATFARPVEEARVKGGRFTWHGGPGGAHVVSFESPLTSAGYKGSVYVLTEEASAVFPDLAALGIEKPANANYDWSVASLPDVRTTDAMTDGNALPDLKPWPQAARRLEGGTYVSIDRGPYIDR